ncbi:MAG: M23 family metallopeptidase [Bacteroidetes bacterium]|nr:M23 family metallopeptidase [Bacteroidota bacterium]
MKKNRKYFYNTKTLRFEKLEVPLHTQLLRVLGFLSAALVSAAIIVGIAFRFLDSPKEKKMRQDVVTMQEKYLLLQKQIESLSDDVSDLEQRDNDIYRSIFEAAPLPDSVRLGKEYSQVDWEQYKFRNTNELIDEVGKEIASLKHRISIQKYSYDTLKNLVHSKEEMLASIPAIQPVSDKTLDHVASGFGYRIDPIYKTPKMHTGLDFAAAMGTPIYATANGVVEDASFDDGGYGNHVILNHGYGYETLYGHMVRIKVRRGEKIKRGQVIGWVGSTGKSTGPHVHYEVIRNGQKINPVHFFFNDLSPTDYERIVKIAAASNQSFD